MFFPWPHAPRGRVVTGQETATTFAIPTGSAPYWRARLGHISLAKLAISARERWRLIITGARIRTRPHHRPAGAKHASSWPAKRNPATTERRKSVWEPCIHGSGRRTCGSSTTSTVGRYERALARRTKSSRGGCCVLVRATSSVASRLIPKSAGSHSTKPRKTCSTTTRRTASARTSMPSGGSDKHLAPFFGNKRMSSITASDIRAYIAKRLAERTWLAQRGGSDIATARGKNCQRSEGLSQPARSIAS